MSQGTLYANFRIRTAVPRSLVRYLKLDVQILDPVKEEAQLARDFPWKKVPAFKAKNFKLTEAMAINYYLINLSQDEKFKKQMLGATIEEQAQVIRWESFANSDYLMEMAKVFQPLQGVLPYNKKSVDAAWANVETMSAILEERLTHHTYLATEQLSLADLVSCACITRGFDFLFGKEWRAQHPAIVRWFNTVRDSEILKEEYKEFKFIEKMIELPKKEKKEQPKKAEKKQAEKPAETAAPQQEKKPKHPLEALGRSTFVLDEWKRKYSNEDTRPVALPWFWEHYNPEEYSLWKVEYKYNDELTMTFMSNNLVGGFFNRLSASTKYMFGSLVVYGENNNNGIIGAVMLRGQDHVPAFDVAPDWESYSYSKLDPTKEEDKEFVNNMWAWDKPVVVNGESKEIADGKVLK
ncbi:translation elongation factor EF1B gamma [Nakaseomyces bracarensis]|uniref:translation elongation factor EF1B gamma n=1 Tax=Nakaseomyces bracarensis TaxID=273131 RepID=UPI0038713376